MCVWVPVRLCVYCVGVCVRGGVRVRVRVRVHVCVHTYTCMYMSGARMRAGTSLYVV